MLLKEKHEKFCQNYILHRNATRAAKDAGYSETSAHNTGSRLLQDTSIQERIEELTVNMTTTIDVVDEIENQYNVARTQGQTTSALKALELLSRIRGNNIDADEITSDSLEEEIVKGMEILGIDKVLELMSKAFPDEIESADDIPEDDESLLATEELESPSDS
jgi:phage terminase small subunit